MAVNLTALDLAAALRVGDSAEETAEVTRLLAYATEAVTRHLGAAFGATPDAVANEAVVRLASYLFDQPTTSRGDAYANAMRSSGAGRMLLPFVVHRAGSTAEAVAAAVTPTPTPTPSTGGVLTSLGEEQVVVVVVGQVYATAVPIPTTEFMALSVDPMGGPDEGLGLARNRFLTDARVQDGAAFTLPPGARFVATTSTSGTVALIHSVADTYRVEVFSYAA